MGTTVNIYYNDRARKQYPASRRSCLLTTIQQPVCVISNLAMGLKDPRLRHFLVHGEKVPVNGQVFLDYCLRVGWPEPDIWIGAEFDIQSWLIDRALDAAHLPVTEVGNKWSLVTEFADLIGLKTDFIRAIQAADVTDGSSGREGKQCKCGELFTTGTGEGMKAAGSVASSKQRKSRG